MRTDDKLFKSIWYFYYDTNYLIHKWGKIKDRENEFQNDMK